MSNDTRRGIKVYLDSSDYAKGIKDITDRTEKYTEKLNELEKAGKGNTAQADKLRIQIEKNKVLEEKYNAQLEETKQILNNLSGTSYNKLFQVRQKIQRQLKDAIPGTKEHTALLEQNRRVTEALTRSQQAMRVEVGSQGTMWSRAVSGFNKYAAVVTAGIMAITGVSMKLNQLREKRDQRESAKADVEALTGLSVESIAWLEKEAVKLSTSLTEQGIRITQSATEILEAYKLVGSAKPELLADKEALAEVTKQTLILASASGMNLKDAVDGVTLAMNQYSAQATQASRYVNVLAAGSKYGAAAVESITKAVSKSGVAAASAGVPIEELVGSIETLAEKGLKDEIAGTGLKKFFLTLQTGANETNPAVVGLSTALENLQKQQLSAAEIKKMFGEEGYNVASVMINEAEKVRDYTAAVTDSVVALEQANIKSQTAEAIRAQAKNRLTELGIELMNRLSPSILKVTNGLVAWSNSAVTLISFIVEHARVIGALVFALGAYTIAIKTKILWEKLHKAAVDAGTVSMKAFNTVLKLNPWGLLISGIAAVISYLTIFKSKTDESTVSVSKFNEELERTKQAMDLINNVKLSADNFQFLNDRQKQQMKADALRGIDLLDDMISKGMITNKKWYESEKKSLLKLAGDNKILQKTYLSGLEHDLKERMEVISGYIDEKKKLESIVGMVGDPEKPKTPQEETDKAKKEALNKSQILYTEHQAKLKAIYAAGNDESLVTEEQYQERLLQLKKDYLNRTISLAGKGTKEAADAENQLADMLLNERKKVLQNSIDDETALYEKQQIDLKNLFISGKDENLKEEKQYNEALEQITIMHLERMLEIAGLNADQRKAIERQLLDIKVKCAKEALSESKKAADADQKLKDKNAQEDKKRLDSQQQQYRQYGEQIGTVLGHVISGQEDALKGFADTMLDVLFDVLAKIIDIEIAKATATATGAVARSTAEAFATPDSVLTFGATGAARAAVMSGLIMGALAAAKSALKGMIRGNSSTTDVSSSSNSDTSKSATVKVSQWAKGNYNVIGEDDGRTYNNIPYIGTPQSGIVNRTSLISENGSELIINAGDLARLQRHMNYPLILSAINDVRQGVVPQRNSGNYSSIDLGTGHYSNIDQKSMISMLDKLYKKLDSIRAYVVLRDIEEAQEIDRNNKETFTKKKR